MFLHLIAIAWMFVVVLMAAAEATAPQGSVLGALVTLLLYGLLPLAILLYILGTPLRRKVRRAREEAAMPTPGALPSDAADVITEAPAATPRPPDGR